jgi:hypothetical protein
VERLAEDRAIFNALPLPQDQLGVGLADGEGEHGDVIDKICAYI